MQQKLSEWFAIINPVAGSGCGLRDWPEISRLLRESDIMPDYAFSEYKYHAIELAVGAINKGYRQIIIVGGDGTLHEVVNGLFIQQQVESHQVLIAVIAVGTGNDWIRMVGIPRKYSQAIKAITEGYSFLQDVGKITYHKSHYKQSRYMANIAGIGFDAYLNRKYNILKEKEKYSKSLFVWNALKSVLRYNSTGVKIWVDEELVVNDLVYSAVVGIGKYKSRGKMSAPEAIPDDGLFDLTTIRQLPLFGVFRRFRSLYNGNIYKRRGVSHNRGRLIRIESSPEVRIEIDGEAIGFSPLEFEIIDRAIRVVVSEQFLETEVKNGSTQNNN